MVDIAPLEPLRYGAPDLSTLVAPPYDVIDAARRAELAGRSPHNVVHIDLPEGRGDDRYETAARLFAAWQAENVLVREPGPAYYRYSQTFDPPGGGERRTRSGFFALVRATAYGMGKVLPHERTLKGAKQDRVLLSRATRATLSPGLLLYSDPTGSLDHDLESGHAFAQFTTDDGVFHSLSKVDEPTVVQRITLALSAGTLIIADGHHRYESAVLLADEIDDEAVRRGETSAPLGEHHYTPALLINGDDPDLVVFPTHRLVHSLPAFDYSSLLMRARDLFDIEATSRSAQDLAERIEQATVPTLAVVTAGGHSAVLTLRREVQLGAHPQIGQRPPVLRDAGVTLLHDGILEPILGITPEAQAAKTNLRYVQDPRKATVELENRRADALFLLQSTRVATVRQVALAGEVMPQKSTFFHPKVPSGLFFHTLLPARRVGSVELP
jgi:uncharacterized protein (DUF1015 family)